MPGITELPVYEQAVGNSFASAYPDEPLETTNASLDKLANVAGGLFRIYDEVVNSAASGAPMTAVDSAIVANVVSNLTTTVGVESFVSPALSLESRAEQSLAYVITQESLGKTIMNAIVKFAETVMGMLKRAGKWLMDQYEKIMDKSRILLRLLNTLDRHAGTVRVPYTPTMSGILVDNQIPANWMEKANTTLGLCRCIGEPIDRMLTYAETIIEEVKMGKELAVEKLGVDKQDFHEQLRDTLKRLPKCSLKDLPIRVSTRTIKNEERTVEYGEPLCGNVIPVALNPVRLDDELDAVNYGYALIPTEIAREYGINESYRLEPADDEFVSLDFTDMVHYNTALSLRLKSHASTSQKLGAHIDKVEGAVSAFVEGIRKNDITAEISDTALSERLMAYLNVARSVLTAAVASAKYNFEVHGRTVNAAIAIITAFNKSNS